MPLMKIHPAFGFLLLTVVLSTRAQEPSIAGPAAPVTDSRHHYVLRDADHVVHYEITALMRTDGDVDSDILLVDDRGHGLLLLETQANYPTQTIWYVISDATRKAFFRATFKLPYTAKTRAGTLAEAHANPALQMMPTLLTLETNGGEWPSVDTDLREWKRLRELRHSIRPTIPFFLLEGIERMRGSLFATVSGDMYYSVVGRFAVYDTTGDTKLDLEEVTVEPACDFDKSFGYPCSDKQLAAIKRSLAAGKIPEHY
jgi:hypothetical protein